MCGLTGILDSGQSKSALAEIARRMGEAIRHRGPDSSGIYAEEGAALAHQRLAVIDLSPAGHQPMESASGRYLLALNGEIYNFRELKKKLDYPFRGSSDTEVLLALIEKSGVREALDKISGMFAVAVWDKERKTLFLARDRIGEKPLYYGRFGRAFVFASELKALRAHPDFNGDLDSEAIALYLRYSYVPDPFSIYENCKKLPPGHMLTVHAPTGEEHLEPYWRLESVFDKRPPPDLEGELRGTIEKVIGEQMVSDVPLGAFLSGGIDSSLVTALMARSAGSKVRTFSVGFKEGGYDESPYAKRVAERLGTEHTELFVTEKDAIDLIPDLPTIYDEPFADSSQIPTCLLARLTRRHVTVALSGDGGDEIFAGYNRYLYGPSLWKKMRPVPKPLRRVLSGFLSSVPSAFLAPVLQSISSQPQPVDKYYKLAKILGESSLPEIYRSLLGNRLPVKKLIGREAEIELPARSDDPVLYQQLNDIKTYLPGDILVKVDRAAMSYSLETRIPFLDHRVVELALHLPGEKKIAPNGEMKLFLRKWLDEFIPAPEFDRPKTGFAVPVGTWLRGNLKSWGADLLNSECEVLNLKEARRIWSSHQSGHRDYSHELWNLLMLQAWLKDNS